MEDDYEEEAYIIKEDVSEAQSSRSYDPDADVEEVKPRFDYFKYFLPNYKKDGDDDSRPIKKDTGILKPTDVEALQKAFNKYDKKKMGSIKPNELADVFRTAGQNPTLEESYKMIAEAEEPGTGMCMFNDVIAISQKYWRSYDNYEEELKEACLAFDRKDMGVMEFEELKETLMKYGEMFDEDEMELFEKSVGIADGKVIVDEFVKMLAPIIEETKKKGKKSAGGGGGAKKGKKK